MRDANAVQSLPGKVAVARDAANVTGGFLLPNSSVDIYSESVTDEQADTEKILENVLVLSLMTTRHRPEGANVAMQFRSTRSLHRYHFDWPAG